VKHVKFSQSPPLGKQDLRESFAARLKAQSKTKIVITGAVMTKLLHIIYGLLKHRHPFNRSHLKKAEISSCLQRRICPDVTIMSCAGVVAVFPAGAVFAREGGAVF
jgi:hypothetical protein